MKVGLVPACAQACPTQSIRFGTIRELREKADARVKALHEAGAKDAYLYGADEKTLGGLGSFYLLLDRPEVYGLPSEPKLPSRNLRMSSILSAAGAVVVGFLALLTLRRRRERAEPSVPPASPTEADRA
jgi:formate dehydrogenase iron-sulfur subunit